jgi:hypothetical protein
MKIFKPFVTIAVIGAVAGNEIDGTLHAGTEPHHPHAPHSDHTPIPQPQTMYVVSSTSAQPLTVNVFDTISVADATTDPLRLL